MLVVNCQMGYNEEEIFGKNTPNGDTLYDPDGIFDTMEQAVPNNAEDAASTFNDLENQFEFLEKIEGTGNLDELVNKLDKDEISGQSQATYSDKSEKVNAKQQHEIQLVLSGKGISDKEAKARDADIKRRKEEEQMKLLKQIEEDNKKSVKKEENRVERVATQLSTKQIGYRFSPTYLKLEAIDKVRGDVVSQVKIPQYLKDNLSKVKQSFKSLKSHLQEYESKSIDDIFKNYMKSTFLRSQNIMRLNKIADDKFKLYQRMIKEAHHEEILKKRRAKQLEKQRKEQEKRDKQKAEELKRIKKEEKEKLERMMLEEKKKKEELFRGKFEEFVVHSLYNMGIHNGEEIISSSEFKHKELGWLIKYKQELAEDKPDSNDGYLSEIADRKIKQLGGANQDIKRHFAHKPEIFQKKEDTPKAKSNQKAPVVIKKIMDKAAKAMDKPGIAKTENDQIGKLAQEFYDSFNNGESSLYDKTTAQGSLLKCIASAPFSFGTSKGSQFYTRTDRSAFEATHNHNSSNNIVEMFITFEKPSNKKIENNFKLKLDSNLSQKLLSDNIEGTRQMGTGLFETRENSDGTYDLIAKLFFQVKPEQAITFYNKSLKLLCEDCSQKVFGVRNDNSVIGIIPYYQFEGSNGQDAIFFGKYSNDNKHIKAIVLHKFINNAVLTGVQDQPGGKWIFKYNRQKTQNHLQPPPLDMVISA